MPYESITIKKEFIIENIYFIHYLENVSDFHPHRQSNHFWKLLHVKQGSVNIIKDGVTYSLLKDNIVFFKPDEYLNICANGTIATTLLIIGFDCQSKIMDFFIDKILEINPAARTLLNNIKNEAHLAYSNDLDNINDSKLKRREESSIPFASEQMIQISLKLLLIRLIRDNENPLDAIPKSSRQESDDDLFYKIINYMDENIDQKLTIQQICKDNLIGRPLLQNLFKDHTGCGTIKYFTNKKVHMARLLIRENKLNFSQIAEKLGYGSIHYFSRQFKNITGMTPTEYQESVNPSTEKPAK